MADGVEKYIEFKAGQASREIDKLIGRLLSVTKTLNNMERAVNSINFEKFTPAISSFVNSFNKIQGVSQNITNIQLMAQALNRFKMTAVELNKSDLTVSFAKISQGIYKFTDSIQRMSLLNDTIQKIASLGLAINRLVNASIKLQNLKVSFTSLTQAIYAFVGSILRIKDLDEATTKLERLSAVLDRLKSNTRKSSINSIGTGLERATKSASSLNTNIMKTNSSLGTTHSTLNRIADVTRRIFGYLRFSSLMRLWHILTRIGSALYDLEKVYAEYQENINLATVAYGGLEKATANLYPFVERLTTAFGLNESQVIRSIGLFKQMGNAMRLTQSDSELLSEGLTKMAYDISSLYNISFDRAMSALQSALVGQTKPIRGATGADITERTLSQTLLDLGIKTEIRDLSYVEKRLVMVISLTKQLANAER